ncbi:MAG TPA: methylated-DNA--[protein]-cysteine S-methyltransferase [Candidatus Limnocylindria bacterium]|jgi:methylated-DNA-[protein]-cysteine S-methyltransferase
MPPRALVTTSLETPIGRLWLSAGAAGLRSVQRTEHPPDGATLGESDALADATRQLAEYFSGSRRGFDLWLDLDGVAPFHVAVYRAAMAIPYGATAAYGDVAAEVGSPRAARAVGRAMAVCPLFPVVPCHRVIHADGSIGGWGPDLWVKRWLLRHEGWR